MNEPFEISVVRSGSDALAYVAARGCGIYLLRRIVLGIEWTAGGGSYRWYRPGGYYDFEVGGEQVEPFIIILKARMPIGSQPGKLSALAHYVRVDRTARAEVQV